MLQEELHLLEEKDLNKDRIMIKYIKIMRIDQHLLVKITYKMKH